MNKTAALLLAIVGIISTVYSYQQELNRRQNQCLAFLETLNGNKNAIPYLAHNDSPQEDALYSAYTNAYKINEKHSTYCNISAPKNVK